MSQISNTTIFHNQNRKLDGSTKHIRERPKNEVAKQSEQVSVLNDISDIAQKQIVGIRVSPTVHDKGIPIKDAKENIPPISPLKKTGEYLEEDFARR